MAHHIIDSTADTDTNYIVEGAYHFGTKPDLRTSSISLHDYNHHQSAWCLNPRTRSLVSVPMPESVEGVKVLREADCLTIDGKAFDLTFDMHRAPRLVLSIFQ